MDLMDNVLLAVEDLLSFVEVADAGGFTAASRRTGIPKSRLSRRVAALESFLGVALLHRYARRFELTDVGQRIFLHGQAVRAETQTAISVARESLESPWGQLRVACPAAIAASLVGRIALQFSARYPRVTLSLQTTDGRLRPLDDTVDLVIQPTTQPLTDSSLVARRLATVPYGLYASPALVTALNIPETPLALSRCAAVGWSITASLARWTLIGPQNESADVELDVRFVSDNLLLNRDAALQGLGVVQLPRIMAASFVASGHLLQVAPDWVPPAMHIYALYPSRRHLTLAGRCFLDMLEDGMKDVGSTSGQPHSA